MPVKQGQLLSLLIHSQSATRLPLARLLLLEFFLLEALLVLELMLELLLLEFFLLEVLLVLELVLELLLQFFFVFVCVNS